MRTRKLRKAHPAWRPSSAVWAVNESTSNRVAHRSTLVAPRANDPFSHVQTVCGTYLLRASLHNDPVVGIDECDACLLDDTVYHVVYICRDSRGVVLYVGYSADLPERIRKHQRGSAWWTSDTRLTYAVHESERMARSDEAEKIRTLAPLHNVNAKRGGSPRPNAKATLHVRLEALEALLSGALNVPVANLTDAKCAAFLGINQSSYYRMRTEPDRAVGGAFVANVILVFGGIPNDLFEARASEATQLRDAA